MREIVRMDSFAQYLSTFVAGSCGRCECRRSCKASDDEP